MTLKERTLVITLLAIQEQRIRALVQILQSRQIIEGDDWNAFVKITELDGRVSKEIMDKVTENYFLLAKSLGVTISNEWTLLTLTPVIHGAGPTASIAWTSWAIAGMAAFCSPTMRSKSSAVSIRCGVVIIAIFSSSKTFCNPRKLG
jgi:hypothetical protein